jgi:hypothetical protein
MAFARRPDPSYPGGAAVRATGRVPHGSGAYASGVGHRTRRPAYAERGAGALSVAAGAVPLVLDRSHGPLPVPAQLFRGRAARLGTMRSAHAMGQVRTP